MKKYIRVLTDRIQRKDDTLVQAGKYLIVGGICTLLDFVLLFTLTNFVGIYYLASSVISFMSATVLNYYLCTQWIFSVRNVQSRKLEFLYYIIISAVGMCLNILLIWVFTEFISFHYMISKVVATLVVLWWNFFSRKYFLHRENRK